MRHMTDNYIIIIFVMWKVSGFSHLMSFVCTALVEILGASQNVPAGPGKNGVTNPQAVREIISL